MQTTTSMSRGGRGGVATRRRGVAMAACVAMGAWRCVAMGGVVVCRRGVVARQCCRARVEERAAKQRATVVANSEERADCRRAARPATRTAGA
jgi:hypothetical protein